MKKLLLSSVVLLSTVFITACSQNQENSKAKDDDVEMTTSSTSKKRVRVLPQLLLHPALMIQKKMLKVKVQLLNKQEFRGSLEMLFKLLKTI